MANWFYIGVFTIRKYIDFLFDKQKLFAQYNYIPQGDRLQHIIDRFQFTCGLPNVVGVIDGTHILLAKKSSRHDTVVPAGFYCAQKWLTSMVI